MLIVMELLYWWRRKWWWKWKWWWRWVVWEVLWSPCIRQDLHRKAGDIYQDRSTLSIHFCFQMPIVGNKIINYFMNVKIKSVIGTAGDWLKRGRSSRALEAKLCLFSCVPLGHPIYWPSIPNQPYSTVYVCRQCLSYLIFVTILCGQHRQSFGFNLTNLDLAITLPVRGSKNIY